MVVNLFGIPYNLGFRINFECFNSLYPRVESIIYIGPRLVPK